MKWWLHLVCLLLATSCFAHTQRNVTPLASCQTVAPAPGSPCGRTNGGISNVFTVVGNGSGPVWCGVTVTSGGSSSNGGFVFPGYQQTNTYDLDGNLTFDGVWAYEWDGENRLRAMTMTNVSGVANAQRKRLEFAYDSEGRRVRKVVQQWNGSSFTAVSTNRFVYDGWNLIAVLDPANVIVQSFLWGQDLSGTRTEAGGIGGLLAVLDHNTSGSVTEAHFCSYDGNGNITALTKASDYQTTARYEYSPFGELIRATGIKATANPFRFSTKYQDEESGLVYYGYRYYSPSLGRWISRDPIEEKDAPNLMGFVGNSPLTALDPLGQETLVEQQSAAANAANTGANSAGSVVRTGNKIKDTIDLVQDLSDIWDAVMAMEDPVAALSQIQDLAAEMLDAKRKGSLGTGSSHHFVPQMLRKLQPHLKDEIDKFTSTLSERLHRRLHTGKGFGRGGIWNGLWVKFIQNKGGEIDAADMEKFMGQLRRLFSLDGLDVKPY